MAHNKKIFTIPTFTFQATNDANIQRFVDRNGDWTHYYLPKQKVFLPAVNHVLGIGYPKDKRFHEYLLKSTKEEATKKLEEKGEAGAKVHEAIRLLLGNLKVSIGTKFMNRQTGKREILTDTEWNCLQTWMDFARKYQLQKLGYEFALASTELDMAGTCDFIGAITIPNEDKKMPKSLWGKTIAIVLDWKTSGAIYGEYGAQTAIYHKMSQSHSKLRRFHACNEVWTGIVRIGTTHADGYELELYDPQETRQNLVTAMHAKAFYDIKCSKKFIPVIEQIPSEFKVRLPLLSLTKKVEPKIKKTVIAI